MSVPHEDLTDFANDPLPAKSPRRRGFPWLSLILLLVILAAIFMPGNRRSAGPAARRAQCHNNLKQIGLALANYESTYGCLPPAQTVDADGKPLHSWRTLILPFLEQEVLYRTIDLSKPWNHPVNAVARSTTVAVYLCPELMGSMNKTTYLGVVDPGGKSCLLPNTPRRLSEIKDRPRDTLMVVEATVDNAVEWMDPVDASGDTILALSPQSQFSHSGGVNGLLLDGSVKFLKATLTDAQRRALISITGNDGSVFND